MRQEAPYILSAIDYIIYAKDGTNSSYLRLGKRTAAPFIRALGKHSHPELELALFTNGTGIYSIGNENYTIQPNDLFIFRSGEQHCITHIDVPKGLTYTTIHFEPRFVWSATQNLFDIGFLSVFNSRNKDFFHRLPRDNSSTNDIIDLIYYIAEEFRQKPNCYELMVKATLLKLLVLLNRHYGSNSECSGIIKQKVQYKAIEASINFIHEHLCEDISLAMLANVAHLNRSYFSTLFKRLNGVTPWEYITARRIEKAQHMLVNSTKSILEIAYSCGYNNNSNFNRAFRQITGMSPSTFRENPEGASLIDFPS